MTAGMPPRWRAPLLERAHRLMAEADQWRPGNLFLFDATATYRANRIPLNATDSDIVAKAVELAGSCMGLAEVHRDVHTLMWACQRVCRRWGIDPPPLRATGEGGRYEPKGPGFLPGGCVARMTCPLWWRRQLRKTNARALENQAIKIGFVHRRKDCYVSNESVARRAQQLRRNAAMLESTIAKNEDTGQEFTLAELAEKGNANKAIRRGELMLRLRGFEEVANELGHEAEFITVTAPPEMHARHFQTGEENDKYDGTTPKEAQTVLGKQWGRARSALARMGIRVYGFRIAEPHHDGCPHWHLLLFYEPGEGALERIRGVFRRYFIGPDASPARIEHGIKFEKIDPRKGGACAYIAKYVAKNIDGYQVQYDLEGNDAITSSRRVDAWASTHGIKQFQQIGGPPVTLWREMRRIKELPADAPAPLRLAHEAVNKTEEKRACWRSFVHAVGGVFIKRKDMLLQMVKEEREGAGRYGDPHQPAPVGVACGGFFARGVRYAWAILTGGRAKPDPWTRVNNCTARVATDSAQGAQSASGKGEKCSDGKLPPLLLPVAP